MMRGRQSYYRWIFALIGCLFLTLAAVTPLPTAIALPQNNQANQLNELEATRADGLEAKDSGKTVTEQQLLSKPLKIDERLEQMSEENIQKHPYLRFRRAMNRPPLIRRCFFYLTLFGVIVLLLRRDDILKAKDVCRKKFFRSFAIGFITLLLLMLLSRPLYLSEIGIPLAFAFIAILELGLSLGLVVSASLIGEKIADLARLNKIAWLIRRPSCQSIVHLVLGALLFSAILLIPGIAHLPRIGTRIVVLIGIAGLGAFVKSKYNQYSS